jgi:hypothetical protein
MMNRNIILEQGGLMSGFKSLSRIGIIVGLVLAGLTPAFGLQFVSHRATYDVELRQSSNASLIEAIKGRTVFSLKRHCDGWQAIEDYAITFSFGQGTSNLVSHYETWESFSGNAFSFSIQENSTFDGPAKYDGYANLDDGKGQVWFFDGDEDAATLPEGTKFPVNHLRAVLSGAAEGKMIHSGPIFLGGEREDSLFYASSIVGKPIQLAADPLLGALGQASYRPLQIAYYKPDATEPVPDYAIEYLLQENGVIRQYSVDYGNFAMRATLMDVTALEEPDC